jgi:glutathione S-transferase
MQLFGMSVSPYVSRVLLVAELKGIALPLVFPQIEGALAKMIERMSSLRQNPDAPLDRIVFMEGTPFMQTVNPLGRMPALEMDGRYLGESTVICEFLEDAFPETPLMPSDPFERAKVRQLCLMSDLYLMSHLWPMAWQIDPLTRNREELRRIEADIHRSLHEIEQVMEDGTWARGACASLADCVLVYSMLMYQCTLQTTTENLGITAFDPEKPFPGHPRLRAWWSHLQRDPAFGAAMTRYRRDYADLFGQLVPDRSPASYTIWLKARCPRS